MLKVTLADAMSFCSLVATYTREPNRARFDMKILDIIDQPTGQIILDLIDDDSGADIDKLDIGVMLLVLIDGFVNPFVIPDTSAEIQRSHFGVLALVIRGRGFDFEDVVHDNLLIVAR